jgi:hypothetical protein
VILWRLPTSGPVRQRPCRYRSRMTEQNVDLSGSTEQFKAFIQHTDAPSTKTFPVGLVVAVIAALVVVGIVVWLVAG